MEEKICPVCGINYIEDNAGMCSICSQSNRSLRGQFQNHTPRKNVSFGETFTFTAEPGFYRGHYGYRAYNSKDEPVGIVFATDDKRTPAYGCCESVYFLISGTGTANGTVSFLTGNVLNGKSYAKY